MRNYKKEYENYHSRPEQKLRRAARNAARASLKKSTAPEKLEGKDVHHKDNDPMNNDKSNLSIVTQKYNRREPRLREFKKLRNGVQYEDMGSVTGPHIAGTGDDNTVHTKPKKKKVHKRISMIKGMVRNRKN